MKYRYILCGVVNPTDKLSDFRLIGANNIGHANNAIRVELPDTVELTKYTCDNYSTTSCDIQIKDLNPIVICKLNGRFKTSKELTEQWLNGKQPYTFHEGKHYATKFGELSYKQYEWYYHNRIIAYRYDKLPVKEDGTLLNIPIPSIDKFMSDINKFKDALIERGYTITDSDEELGLWYHLCSCLSNEQNWRKFESIKFLDRFLSPYTEHLDFRMN